MANCWSGKGRLWASGPLYFLSSIPRPAPHPPTLFHHPPPHAHCSTRGGATAAVAPLRYITSIYACNVYAEFTVLQDKYGEQGLVIQAFPCNQVLGAVTGRPSEIGARTDL